MTRNFATSITGKSIPTPFVVTNDRVQEPKTIVVGAQYHPLPLSQYNQFDQGIPSQHQYFAQTEPVEVSQGTPAIFNAWLYHNGEQITEVDWDITVILKPSEYVPCYLWEGKLNDGVYKIEGEEDAKDFFQIWIPETELERLLAGTYWFDIVVTEKVGRHDGVKPRRVVLGTYPFYLYYSPSSPNPESISNPEMNGVRSNGKKTFPLPINITQL